MLVSDGQRRIGARWSVTDEALCEGRGGAGSLTVALCLKKKKKNTLLTVTCCLYLHVYLLQYVHYVIWDSKTIL